MPINVSKLIQYWKQGAEEDLDTARFLLKNNRRRQGLFFAHLALEKALKACVVKATGAIAPYSHDLPYLAKCAKLELAPEKVEFLGEMNQYVFQGRYPDLDIALPPLKEIRKTLQNTEEMVQWLIQKL
jgi:HEPN domain-containing protein